MYLNLHNVIYQIHLSKAGEASSIPELSCAFGHGGCPVPPLKGIVYIPKDGETLGSTGSFQGEVSVASMYNFQGMILRLLFCSTDPRTHSDTWF